MTAIVGVLNSRGIAIAADSAVTVSGTNGKKVYNNGNKIFTLSKIHPVGIAIFSSADFLGIPLETLIKVYRKKLGDTSFNTVEEYQNDFIDFIKAKIPGVSENMKERALFGFIMEDLSQLIKKFKEKLHVLQAQLLNPQDAAAIALLLAAGISEVIQQHQQEVNQLHKAAYINKTFEEFITAHDASLQQIPAYILTEVQKEFPEMILNQDHIDSINRLLYSTINIALIYENYCGIVFFGFGEEELFPSSHQIWLGCPICDEPRLSIAKPVQIIPGELDSNILPYVQGDVTNTVLTGVDPSYKQTMKDSIKTAFQEISTELTDILNNPQQSTPLATAINDVGTKLIQDLDEYQNSTFTGPLLEILNHMGKEDMSELAESLVNITSLKRKFTSANSSDESVGGPVDVAIVTKGDGFVWMKRKQYFNIENNRDFYTKYHK